MKRIVFLILVLTLSLQVFSQRNMENLDRGVYVMRSSSNQVFVSWRILGTEFSNVTVYNLYRDTSLIAYNLNVSNYVDNITTNSTYRVAAVVDSIEQPLSAPVGVNTKAYYSIPLQWLGADYFVQHAWVGDLDGDGKYDYVVGRLNFIGEPNKIEAYSSNGVFLWRVDLGPNSLVKSDDYDGPPCAIANGHGDHITVYDLDSDGKSEVIIISADGVIFGDGAILKDSNWLNQYISVLEGTTGKELARDTVPQDFKKDGALNGHFGIMYCDGIHPNFVYKGKNRVGMGGFNILIAAWDYSPGNLNLRWKYVADAAHAPASFHQIRTFDVDGNGTDEISDGGFVLNSDGTMRYVLGVTHGDRFHITDMDPDRPGLEGYAIQQNNPSALAWVYFDASDGTWLSSGYTAEPADLARGTAGDIDPRYKGVEMWTFTDGIYTPASKTRISTDFPWPNFIIWWDGDLGAELLNREYVDGWDYTTQSTYRILSANSFGAVDSWRDARQFDGDIMGDWRSEIIFENSNHTELMIFATTIPTPHRIYSLAHNPAYRLSWTYKGYMQSNLVDFYLGDGMDTPAAPNIKVIGEGEKRTLPNGFYFIESLYSGLLLDTINDLTQQKSNDQVGQVWKILKNENHYEIYSMAAHKYLSYSSDSIGSSLYLADSANKSLFDIVEDAHFIFNISPVNDSSVVVVAYDTTGIENKFKFADKTSSDYEKFIFKITGNFFDCNSDWKGNAKTDNCDVCAGGKTGYLPCTTTTAGQFKIKNSVTGLYLTQIDTDILLKEEINSKSQAWRIIKNGDSYSFSNLESNKYLNLQSVEKGALVVPESTIEKFRLEKQAGKYFLKPEGVPELCLQIQRSVNENTHLVLNTFSFSDSNTFVFEKYIPTNINGYEENTEIKIIPNPVNDKFRVILPKIEEGRCNVTIINHLGQELKTVSIINNNIIDISDLTPGIYFLKVKTERINTTVKLIKNGIHL